MNTTSKNLVSRTWPAALAILVTFGADPAQSQDLAKALAGCATIAESDARLTCFDALAALLVDGQDAEQAGAPAVVAAVPVVVAAAPAAEPTPLTDAVGKERIEPQADDEREKYSARVVSCQESVQSGQYYFTFENGQVWKQSNYRRLGFRNCDFDIEISKGSWGYNMYIPSKDRSIRVARVK
jgi:hypothetical protein